MDLTVQNEQGSRVEDALVSVSYGTANPERGSFNIDYTGLSDKKDPLRFKERGVATYITVSKDGFWKTSYKDEWPEAIDSKVGWYYPETSKETTLVLREMQNPRPLFVHNVKQLRLYEFNVEYGFDLTVGDLVRPYGKGVRTDFIFTMEGEVNEETKEYDVVTILSFPNEGDGVIPVKRSMLGNSELLLGQEAPEEGYQPVFEMHASFLRDGRIYRRKKSPNADEQSSWEGMWFRVHTEMDPETGEVLNSRYGKIYANLDRVIPFGFGLQTPTRKMYWEMEFIYFYAPDHSRSLEFNGKTLVPNGNLQGVSKR